MTRNPMYVGWAFIHLGTGLVLRSPGLLVTMPLMFVRIHRSVLAEEQVLLERFGDEYTKYLAGVPRYLGPVLPPQKCP